MQQQGVLHLTADELVSLCVGAGVGADGAAAAAAEHGQAAAKAGAPRGRVEGLIARFNGAARRPELTLAEWQRLCAFLESLERPSERRSGAAFLAH